MVSFLRKGCERMSSQEEREANLIVVAAVEEYDLRHHMPVKEVLSLF